MRSPLLASVVAAALVGIAAGQEISLEDHWAIKLGQRIASVDAKFPVINQVVLVPDPAAYLQELGRWSPEGIWPVLIEDGVRTPQFIKRFQPSRVIRRSDRGSPPQDHHELFQQIKETIISTWGGDVTPLARPEDAFAHAGHLPSGVVLTSGKDPAWTAAVALAAARGQLIGLLDGNLGRPSVSLGPTATTRVVDAVSVALDATGARSTGMGEGIDTVTICRVMSSRATAPEQMELAGNDRSRTVAVTDLLGRLPDGTRHAMVGWIFGDESHAAAMAMSSLFLGRISVTCLDTYPSGNPWEQYGFDLVASGLKSAGYEVTADEDVTLNRITTAWSTGLEADILLLNSKGNADFFDLYSGRGGVGDLPLPIHPMCVSMIHSWSAKAPDDRSTIAGAMLHHGAYAYVGSVHEPYLHAFVPPAMVAQRLALGVPFLVATRWWPDEGRASRVWRIATIGDPQMTAPPPAMRGRSSALFRKPCPSDGATDLTLELIATIERAGETPSPEIFADAISLATIVGRDDMAASLYQAALEREMGTESLAQVAMESLHHSGDAQRFEAAYRLITAPTPRQMDLLWSLLGGQLDGAVESSTLDLLEQSLRPTTAWSDVQRLAPVVRRVRGPLQARTLVQRQIDRLDSGAAKNQLKTLLQSIR